MPQQNNAGLIRLGLLALPLAGILVLVGTLGGFGVPDPDVDTTGAAQAVITTGYFVTQFVGNILGVTLVIFGAIALFAYLINTSGGRLASWAMVLSVFGLGVLLSFFGIVTYASPALAQEYLNGQQNAPELINAISDQVFGVLILGNLLFFVGFVLFGVAIWRSGVLPKWAGVLLAIAGLFLAVPADAPVANLLGSMLLLIAGGWIALSASRRPSERVESPQAEPRVQ